MRTAQLNVYIHCIVHMQITKHYTFKKNFYGWDEKTYWKSIHGQSSAVGKSGMVREIKEFVLCVRLYEFVCACVYVSYKHFRVYINKNRARSCCLLWHM